MTDYLDAVRAGSLRMTVREAVQRVTAFCCERDLRESLADGYCPTLRVTPEPMGVEEGRDNHAVRLVRQFVVDSGHAYFDGRRVVRGLTRRLLAKYGAERETVAEREREADGAEKRELFFRGYRLSRALDYLKERLAR